MTVCNCTGGCNCCKNWFKPSYGVPVQPVYYPPPNDEEIDNIKLQLANQALLIDSLQSNLEKLHDSVQRIEKALDSICG